jgi:transcriptional regulator with XRE-family HTH domain
VTNEKVVELIKGGVKSLGVRGLARAVGISPAIITRYAQGKVGEPSQSTIEKLAYYFGVRTRYLRGEAIEPLDWFLEGLRLAGVHAGDYNKKIYELDAAAADEGADEGGAEEYDYWDLLLRSHGDMERGAIEHLCEAFGIDPYWVETGREPTLLTRQGLVGGIDTPPTVPYWMNVHMPVRVSPYAVCAKCGGELKEDDKGKEYDPNDSLRFWPCKTCCKS